MKRDGYLIVGIATSVSVFCNFTFHLLLSDPVHAQGPSVVRAQQFVVVDQRGRTRGTFGFTDALGGPTLRLVDLNGMDRVMLSLSVGDSQPGLFMADEKGVSRLNLVVLGRYSSSLNFYDSNGKLRVGLGSSSNDGEPSLGLFTKDGKGGGWLDLSADGLPRLREHKSLP